MMRSGPSRNYKKGKVPQTGGREGDLEWTQTRLCPSSRARRDRTNFFAISFVPDRTTRTASCFPNNFPQYMAPLELYIVGRMTVLMKKV